MSALIGKFYKPRLGANYKRQPIFSEEVLSGAYGEQAQALAPNGFEVVGIESGHVLVKMPNGRFTYMNLSDGEINDPPPPPKPVNVFHQTMLEGIAATDRGAAVALAHSLGHSDWQPPEQLDLSGMSPIRAFAFNAMAQADPALARVELENYRASDEATVYRAALEAQAAAPQPEPFTATSGADQLRALFGGGQ